MTRLLTSTTDQVGVPARCWRLLLDPDVVENINIKPNSSALWQGYSFYGRADESTSRTVPHIEPLALLTDTTEQFVRASIPVWLFNGQTCVVLGAQNGALLRLDPQGNLSDFTNEPARDRRWTSIVQEELGTPAVEVLVDGTETDPALSDTTTVDCIMFCREHGILDDLRKCLAKAKEQFSNVVALKAELDQFPSDEYEEEGHVHIRIEVTADQDTAFREYDEYTAWALDAIEDDKIHFFLPTVSRVDDKSR